MQAPYRLPLGALAVSMVTALYACDSGKLAPREEQGEESLLEEMPQEQYQTTTDIISEEPLSSSEKIPVTLLQASDMSIVGDLCERALVAQFFSSSVGAERSYYTGPVHKSVRPGTRYGRSEATFYMYPDPSAVGTNEVGQVVDENGERPPIVKLSAPLKLPVYHFVLESPLSESQDTIRRELTQLFLSSPSVEVVSSGRVWRISKGAVTFVESAKLIDGVTAHEITLLPLEIARTGEP